MLDRYKYSGSFGSSLVIGCIFFLILGYGVICNADQSSLLPTDDQKILQDGERIYRFGILPSGENVSATAEADIELNGSQAACANCHRRSGMGTNEGQLVIPPVTRDFLFKAKTLGRKDQFAYKTTGAGTRPAYSDLSLKQAISKGIDPTSRPFKPMMPRFNFSSGEMEALIAYLKTLQSSGAPGVDETTMHFATIVTDRVNSDKKKAMLDVLNTFFKEKNAGTRSETRRSKYAPWHRDWKYQSYRKWKLHVWELKGPASTWIDQIADYYQRQPVFALISGLAEGPWDPIHFFCEQHQIPCLFPNTDQPVNSESDYYTFYFSRGVELEADLVIKFLDTQTERASRKKIVQVYRPGTKGNTAALRLRQLLNDRKGNTVVDFRLENATPLNGEFWQSMYRQNNQADWVLWLESKDLAHLDQFSHPQNGSSRIFLSSTLAPDWNTRIPQPLIKYVYAVHPYEKSSAMRMHLIRSNSWLATRKIATDKVKIQANAYFALRSTGRAIMHLRDKFSRDYFIELIEHTAEKLFVSSVYPRLTLAPGQRYASKGGYILQVTTENQNVPVPVSKWLIP